MDNTSSAATMLGTYSSVEQTVYMDRNEQRLNCLQAPLVWTPGAPTPYEVHKKNIFVFFELIFYTLFGDAEDQHFSILAEKYFMLLGWLQLLNRNLVARYVTLMRIKKDYKTFWTCTHYDIPTTFGRIFFKKMYPPTSAGWRPRFAEHAIRFWRSYQTCQGIRIVAPNAIYRRLTNETGTSLAEVCATDVSVPIMKIRHQNALAYVIQTDATFTSPFAFRGQQTFTRSWEFYDEDGQELEPTDGTVIEKPPRFDFTTIDLTLDD